MKSIEEKRAEQTERRILQIVGRCVHFTGIQHSECKASVNYHAQFGTGTGCFANIPCTTFFDTEPPKHCPSVKYPSRQEAEQEEAEEKVRSVKASSAMRSAHADATAKGYGIGKGGSDSMKCPFCEDGTLAIPSHHATVTCMVVATMAV